MKRKSNIKRILTINGGSSSIKFACYQNGNKLKKEFHGSIDRIGLSGTKLTFENKEGNQNEHLPHESNDNQSAANFLIDWLEKQIDFSSIEGIGHRVVFGMNHINPEYITSHLLDDLHRITPYDPDHLPTEIELIEAFLQRFPILPQVACFDTAFHSTKPRVAKLLPIPRRFDSKGIQRYGFHGLSYSYLMEELARIDAQEAQDRVILAHLGSGASMAAVKVGKCIDTSMGFTPTSGIMMGTRPGDLDPGVAWYIIKSEKLTPKQFNTIINHESGLLGISETSSDMHDLLAMETKDIRAEEAIALFCYQARKCIGSFAAVLGGLDTLVFAGGIGEKAPVIRSRICEGMEFFGIELDKKQNEANAPIISTKNEKAVVRVIHTDEEEMIAKTVSQLINITY